MFDMLQATCSSYEKGAWHFVRPDFGFFKPDFDETDMLLGRDVSGRGIPAEACTLFVYHNFMTLTYLTCERGKGTPAEA